VLLSHPGIGKGFIPFMGKGQGPRVVTLGKVFGTTL